MIRIVILIDGSWRWRTGWPNSVLMILITSVTPRTWNRRCRGWTMRAHHRGRLGRVNWLRAPRHSRGPNVAGDWQHLIDRHGRLGVLTNLALWQQVSPEIRSPLDSQMYRSCVNNHKLITKHHFYLLYLLIKWLLFDEKDAIFGLHYLVWFGYVLHLTCPFLLQTAAWPTDWKLNQTRHTEPLLMRSGVNADWLTKNYRWRCTV